jgi:colanic acid biosynthesis protein WcaH
MYIEDNLYKKIVANMPIFCMELVIKNSLGQVLLIKRNNNPAKNQWWTCGGRFLHGETIGDGVKRVAWNEVRLHCKFEATLELVNEIFPRVDEMECDKHTPALVCEVVIDGDNEDVALDRDHAEYIWVDKNSVDYHEYVQEILRLAGFGY